MPLKLFEMRAHLGNQFIGEESLNVSDVHCFLELWKYLSENCVEIKFKK